MKKGHLIFLILILSAAVFWFWYPLRSLTVMSLYTAIHNKNSIMTENNFIIEMPGGISTLKRDWYPFVMTFNADNYKARGNEISGMTILYNFPAFNPLTRTNIFYDTDSHYSSAFYGAYIIKANGPIPYCFNEDDSVNYEEIMDAFSYDYKNLVLESLGSHNFIFAVNRFDSEQTEYLGYDKWTKVDAEFTTNMVTHSFIEPMRSYIQYGRPLQKAVVEFPETDMSGRLYIKYFSEISSTVIMYVMAPAPDVIQECDELILSKSTINLGKE